MSKIIMTRRIKRLVQFGSLMRITFALVALVENSLNINKQF